MLHKTIIPQYKTIGEEQIQNLVLTYELFGPALGSAPIVLVTHALTGNSSVTGEHGWWNGLVGPNRCIDTNNYTVIAFNIPGNGYQQIESPWYIHYQMFCAGDIAAIFGIGLQQLGIQQIYAAIGGSIGGAVLWELAVRYPKWIQHIIPIASDWKSTDWVKANCLVQDQILKNSTRPIHDARLHAMLTYRSPTSFKTKFNRSFHNQKGMYNVESWILHHGQKLEQHFSLQSYQMLNYILGNIDILRTGITFETAVTPISSHIHLISIDSDLFFTPKEDQLTYAALLACGKQVRHGIIQSDHGHDAFLIEFAQLEKWLSTVFKPA